MKKTLFAALTGQTPRLAAVAVLTLTLGSPARIGGQETADDRAGIVGSWRVVSYQLEFQDGSQPTYPLGMRPNGFMVFGADGRMMAYLEAGERKAPQTDAEQAAAYRTLRAYTGKYRAQGDKFVIKVDGAWNVEWVGTDQERSFSLSGNRLQVVAQWNRNALYGGKITRGHLVFERER